MRKVLCAAIAAGFAASASAGMPMPFGDDLTDGAFDPIFNYDFSSDFTGPGTDFNELDSFGLCLCADEVEITFPGIADPIGLFQVDFGEFAGAGATQVTFTGTLGSLTLGSIAGGSGQSLQAGPTDGLGAITSVSISGFETFVTRISVRTIPAPGTVAMLGLGGLAAVRRRR